MKGRRIGRACALVAALVVGTTLVSGALPFLGVPAAEAAPPRPRTPKKPPVPKPDPKVTEPAPDADAAEPKLERSNRMELDARLVRGETARSGAVYLFQRAPRRLPPLVDLHQSYLDEIVVPVLGDEPVAEAAPTTPAAPATPTPPKGR